MIVSVRDVTAKCRACGASDFAPQEGERLRLDTPMACSACGAKTSYRELLEQIGEEAIARANKALAALRKGGKGAPPRKPRK